MSRRPARATEAEIKAREAFVEEELRRYREEQREIEDQKAHDRAGNLAMIMRVAREHGGSFDLVISPDGGIRMQPTDLGELRVIENGRIIPTPQYGRIYFVGFAHYVKIGYTSRRTVKARIAALQTACPERLVLYHELDGDFSTESDLHRKFAADRLEGEWFRYSDAIKAWIEEAKRG